MPDCGPRDPRSPAPLRPLLLLLCALAPGATGLASGGWPPRFVSSAPLPLQTVRPPRPGCEDRGGDRGPPDPDSAIGAAWRGRSPAAFSGFCVPTSRTAVCVPPRGLGFQRLDEAQSVCWGVAVSTPSLLRVCKAGCGALRERARVAEQREPPTAPPLGAGSGCARPCTSCLSLPRVRRRGAERGAGASSRPARPGRRPKSLWPRALGLSRAAGAPRFRASGVPGLTRAGGAAGTAVPGRPEPEWTATLGRWWGPGQDCVLGMGETCSPIERLVVRLEKCLGRNVRALTPDGGGLRAGAGSGLLEQDVEKEQTFDARSGCASRSGADFS